MYDTPFTRNRQNNYHRRYRDQKKEKDVFIESYSMLQGLRIQEELMQNLGHTGVDMASCCLLVVIPLNQEAHVHTCTHTVGTSIMDTTGPRKNVS